MVAAVELLPTVEEVVVAVAVRRVAAVVAEDMHPPRVEVEATAAEDTTEAVTNT
jgi:hypothetical protein